MNRSPLLSPTHLLSLLLFTSVNLTVASYSNTENALIPSLDSPTKQRLVKSNVDQATDIPSCGWNMEYDRFCDPLQLLSAKTALLLQKKLVEIEWRNHTRSANANSESNEAPTASEHVSSSCNYNGVTPPFGPQVAFALTRRVSDIWANTLLDVFDSYTMEEFARFTARRLHDVWGVGRAKCNDGILMLLALDDRQVYISTGKGVKYIITDDMCQDIISAMRPYLRAGKLDEAMLLAAEYIAAEFQSTQPASLVARIRKRYFSPIARVMYQLAGPIMMLGFVVIVNIARSWTQRSHQASQQSSWQEARARLLEIERARDAALASDIAVAEPHATHASVNSTSTGATASTGAHTSAGNSNTGDHDETSNQDVVKRSATTHDHKAANDSFDEEEGYEDMEKESVGLLSSQQLRRRVRPTTTTTSENTLGSAAERNSSGTNRPDGSGWLPTIPLAARLQMCPICLDSMEESSSSASTSANTRSGNPVAPQRGMISATETSTTSRTTRLTPVSTSTVPNHTTTNANDHRVSTITLPCRHRFHVACLDSWMSDHNTCPICRAVAHGAQPGAGGTAATGTSTHNGNGTGSGSDNARPSTTTTTAAGYDHTLDMYFLMESMHRRYPVYVPRNFAARDALLRAPLTTDQRFRDAEPAVRAQESNWNNAGGGSFSHGFSGGSFGGGSSFGGGGGGGSW